MGIKRALFFGGAVLVLAACDSATAPTNALSRSEGPAASAQSKPTKSKKTTTTTTTTSGTTTTTSTCDGGFVIRQGADSVVVGCEGQ